MAEQKWKGYVLVWLVLGVWGVACGKFQIRQRPIRIIHGLTGDCRREGPNCIETGAGNDTFFDLKLQARKGCEGLKAQIFDSQGQVREDFLYGFHLIGISQGGIIVRLVYKNCPEVRPLIRTLSTYATPNTGMELLFKPFDFMGGKSWEEFTWEKAREYEIKNNVTVDKRFTLATLLNYPARHSDILGELEDRSWGTYEALEMFANIYFGNDTLILPRQSMSFETPFNLWNFKFENFRGSRYYRINGLGELFEERGLWFCRAQNDHLVWRQGEYEEAQLFVRDPVDPTEFDTLEEALARYKSNLRKSISATKFQHLKCDMEGMEAESSSRLFGSRRPTAIEAVS